MFAYETQVRQLLAFLVVCHDIAVSHIAPRYIMFQKPMSWFQAREFCQRHFVDLAVLSTEEQYFTLHDATAAKTLSFWLGLQRQSTFADWRWVDGEELSYGHWYRRNYDGRCASLEAMLQRDDKLLARFCDELHMFVCQGPVSPQSVTADPVGTDHMTLSWNVSAFMQMTPHLYNVTTCTSACETLFYPYANGSAFMKIRLSNLTSATEHFIHISALIVRPDGVAGGNATLQSNPTTLRVRTAADYNVVIVVLKWLKLISLVPPLWILYRFLEKDTPPVSYDFKEPGRDAAPLELSVEVTIDYPMLHKTRGFG